MRVGELSVRSGVSVPSIKYYLREGLLAAGDRTAANQAAYDDAHLHRLRLVRALIEVGGLSVAAAREVVAAMDDGDRPLHDLLGAAQSGVTTAAPPDDDPLQADADARLAEVVTGRGWAVSRENPAWTTAVRAMAMFLRLGEGDLAHLLGSYVTGVEDLARDEVAAVLARGDRESVVEGVVVGTVVGDTLLGALRRLAHEHVSRTLLLPG